MSWSTLSPEQAIFEGIGARIMWNGNLNSIDMSLVTTVRLARVRRMVQMHIRSQFIRDVDNFTSPTNWLDVIVADGNYTDMLKDILAYGIVGNLYLEFSHLHSGHLEQSEIYMKMTREMLDSLSAQIRHDSDVQSALEIAADKTPLNTKTVPYWL